MGPVLLLPRAGGRRGPGSHQQPACFRRGSSRPAAKLVQRGFCAVKGPPELQAVRLGVSAKQDARSVHLGPGPGRRRKHQQVEGLPADQGQSGEPARPRRSHVGGKRCANDVPRTRSSEQPSSPLSPKNSVLARAMQSSSTWNAASPRSYGSSASWRRVLAM